MRTRANGICVDDYLKEMHGVGPTVPIDIGSPAIYRSDYAGENQTLLDFYNPANANGIITAIKYWIRFVWYPSDMKVGTFFLVGGSTYQCRDAVNIGVPIAGSEQTVAVTLAVLAGDFMGVFPGTWTDIAWAGPGHGAYQFGDQCIIGHQSTYYVGDAGQHISLYGIGN